jgi:carbonic anhydrase
MNAMGIFRQLCPADGPFLFWSVLAIVTVDIGSDANYSSVWGVFGGGTVPNVKIKSLQTYLHLSIKVLALTLLATAFATGQGHKSGHWGYDGDQGPSHWGDMSPEFAPCKTGHHQSPIDIRNPQKADLPPIVFDYKPSPLHIIDNGHTVMINYAPGSSIRVGDKQYILKQFHFHRPSEEKINGKAYDMVVHLVHADQNGNLAVVAVLLEKGNNNPLIRELWNDLPKEKEKEELLDTITINAVNLLPADTGYFTFSGSLTTPPCSENVTWFVLKHPEAITAEEIEQFAKLYRHDARPTQPLYDREVLESK